MKKLIEELVALVPQKAIQISILEGEYVIGWESSEWPYIASRRSPTLKGALDEAIIFAKLKEKNASN